MKKFNRSECKLLGFYNQYQDALNIILLIGIPILVFYNSLGTYFFPVDDFGHLINSSGDISGFFVSNTWGGSEGGHYRPMEVLSHSFDTFIYGSNNPFGHRLTNLTIHILNVILVYLLASCLTQKKIVALLAGLFFAVHPVHGQSLTPVVWISGRTDLILTFFYLLTLIFFARFLSNRSHLLYLISLVTFFMALISKEVAMTLPFVILLYVILFASDQARKEAYQLHKKAFGYLCLSGILLLAVGIILNPNFVASYLSSDGILAQHTYKKIRFIESILVWGGFIIIIATVLLKLSERLFKLFYYVRYCIPYLIISLTFLIARFLLLGGLGGYGSANANLVLQLGPDTFVRDVFSLFGLVWPVRGDYNLDILTLQVEHPFIFFTVFIMVSITLLVALFKLIASPSRVLIFSYLWIFITLMPLHNILVASAGTFRSRYLYLPSVGFCILISVLLHKLARLRGVSPRLTNVMIASFVILAVNLSSMSIIKHNRNLAKSGEIVEKLVSDIKRYQSKISDTTHLYFITFPLSPIDIVSNVRIRTYMNDVLNFALNSSRNQKRYNYDFILFMRDGDNNQVEIDWLNERSFVMNTMGTSNYFIIPNERSSIENRINEIYGVLPPHPTLRALHEDDGSIEAINSIIDVLKLDKKSDRVKLKVELKGPVNEMTNSLFFIYEKGDFHLVEELNGRKQNFRCH